MSDTPETDKNVSVGLENADRECVPVDFCRKLERERDEAREAFVIATDQMVIAQGKVREANKERDEARRIITSALASLPVGYIPAHTADTIPSRIADLCKAISELERERDEVREAFLEMWQSGDAFLPHVDAETISRWHKAAGWEGAK
jgi:hypothetical protein